MSNETNYQDLIGKEIYFFAQSFEPVKGIITDVSVFNEPLLHIKCEYDSNIAIIEINQNYLQTINDQSKYLKVNIKGKTSCTEKVSFNKDMILSHSKDELASLKKLVKKLQNHITKLENE
jgi:L-arabinose isomerase